MLGQQLGGRGSPRVRCGRVGRPQGAQVGQPLALQQKLALQLLLLLLRCRHLGRTDLQGQRFPGWNLHLPQTPCMRSSFGCLSAAGRLWFQTCFFDNDLSQFVDRNGKAQVFVLLLRPSTDPLNHTTRKHDCGSCIFAPHFRSRHPSNERLRRRRMSRRGTFISTRVRLHAQFTKNSYLKSDCIYDKSNSYKLQI